jgi:hypothetical protein
MIEACVEHLMVTAPKTEGIFRLSASQEEIEKLCDLFRFGDPDVSQLSPHLVACCLKYFLREIIHCMPKSKSRFC